MKTKQLRIPLLILAVYIIATAALLFFGYRGDKPETETAEFPFSVTYVYQGETETYEGVFVTSPYYGPKRMGESNVSWTGYVRDAEPGCDNFFYIEQTDTTTMAVDLNLNADYLMGNPDTESYSWQTEFVPTGSYYAYAESGDTYVRDPAELEKLGLQLISWDYPEPIENSFRPGGVMLSAEGCTYLAMIAMAALAACLIFVRKDQMTLYKAWDKLGIFLNILVAVMFFPLVMITGILSEIYAGHSLVDFLVYILPSVTLASLGVSVCARRKGYRKVSLLSQLAGPVMLALVFVLDFLL